MRDRSKYSRYSLRVRQCRCISVAVGPRRVQQLEAAGILRAVRTRHGQRLFDPRQVEEVRRTRAEAKQSKARRP
jgi:hypothetical protein